jgi:hypothetical protein
VGYVEINEQSCANAAEPQVRQELGLVNGMDRFYAFHFDDDGVLDDPIDAVPEFDFLAVVDHGQTDLAGHAEPARRRSFVKLRMTV